MASPVFKLAPVSSFEVMLQYGCSKRGTDEPVGCRILRMNNLQADGWRLHDLKHVQLTPDEFANWRLERGDIVLNRTNSKELVGKCEVFDEPGEWVFASYLMRLRVNTTKALPEFVTAFLNTRAGRVQIDRQSRQIIGMSNINAAEIRALRIPLPNATVQRGLLASLNAARAARRRKLEEAEALLGNLDSFVLGVLGLALPPPSGRTVYAVRRSDIERNRFDPHFFRPEYRELARRMSDVPHVPLGELVRVSREVWSPAEHESATFRYIEIGGVNTTTGEATATEMPVSEAPSRAKMRVRCGDIIVSLTRPQRGAIAAIDDSLDGCVASTGFAILRESCAGTLNRSYLWILLRCQASLMQMQQRSSGGNYPAITEDELARVLVPMLDGARETEIVAEVSRRRDAARRLREEAVLLWDDAKRDFEEALLGPPPSLPSPLTSAL